MITLVLGMTLVPRETAKYPAITLYRPNGRADSRYWTWPW